MVATSSPTGAGIGPSPFHSGEQQVQELTGARDISEQLGRAWLSKELSATTAEFFSQQQLLYTASRLVSPARLQSSDSLQALQGGSTGATPLVQEPGWAVVGFCLGGAEGLSVLAQPSRTSGAALQTVQR